MSQSDFVLRANWLQWLPVVAGLLVLYIPTYITLAYGEWNDEQNAHGPLVLAIIAWLVWQRRDALTRLPESSAPVAGWAVLIIGLLFYIIGRAFEFPIFEALSQIPVAAGALLLLRGHAGLRLLWFPVFYLVFLIPLPGFVIDVVTAPLKHLVSIIVENVLYGLGYPIARSGVVLVIGAYQLLVADACSGLNSMYSLTALGLLFLYLSWDGNWLRTIAIAMSIWPIAFAANIIRVVALVLITYYFGDSAGQGFLHTFSGIALFVIALSLLLAINFLVNLLMGVKQRGYSQ